jgi:cytochrome P450
VAHSRRKIAELGAETARDQADNTLDGMMAREALGEFEMSDAEIKDEIITCMSLTFRQLIVDLFAGTETTGSALKWVSDIHAFELTLVAKIHDQPP